MTQTQVGVGAQSLTFNGNNQITNPGYIYDAAGNLMMDNVNCYSYDAENRLSSVAPETGPGTGICGATTMSYLYDPEGRRVARLQSGFVVKQYYYEAAGNMIKLADSIEKRVEAGTNRAEKLTQAILAKAFRGEFVPTEAELARREGRDYKPDQEVGRGADLPTRL